MIRSFAIVVVLLLGGQAFASGARVMVCKYTGRVMADCPCPPAADDAQLERQACCDVVSSAPFTPAAVLREGVQLEHSHAVALPRPALLIGADVAELRRKALPESQASPDERQRFLRLRHLLK